MGKLSTKPTYDSSRDGLQYTISTSVNGRNIGSRKIADPFVNHTVSVSLIDTLKSLLKGGVKMNIVVYASIERMDDVMELDAEYIGSPARRKEWNKHINKIVASFVNSDPVAKEKKKSSPNRSEEAIGK